MTRHTALSTTMLGLAFAVGLAASARAQTPEDPWEHWNRRNYEAHDVFDKKILWPLARLYHALTPGIIGQGIHHVLVNLSEPVTFANDVLQVRPKRAFHTSVRFVSNSLAGIGGLMDVAGRAGIPHKDNDFGVTLGVWGFKSGPYIFAPLVGPTTVRDLTGTVIQAALDPFRFVDYRSRTQIDITWAVVGGLDKRYSSEADLNALLEGSTDPYATLRSAYLQDREANVEDREAPPANLPDIESEPAPQSPSSQPPPSSQGEAPPPAEASQPPPATETAPPPQAMAAPAHGADADARVASAEADADGPISTAGADARPILEAAL
ncbi:MAG TPA: VacJ family lipoprotein [Caulobacteraceae bacterium]|nr:VacJ family lipoprotein [Caulobacteraceae bacterium]